jgi:hypothetical protein
MASYATDRKVFVIKTFYTSRGSCVAVVRQYRRDFFVGVPPSIDSVYRIIKRFEGTIRVRVINTRRDMNNFILRLH